MEQDLTQGGVMSRLFHFALPLLFANVLQSLYNLVDMAIVGRFVGSAGLAAVSSSAMICYVLTSICMGVTTGGGVLVAQYHGAGDPAGRQAMQGALFSLSALTAALLTLVSYLAYAPVLRLMSVPAEAMVPALDYMAVFCAGTPFVLGYNAFCAVLRGVGDSKSPLVFVALASVVNVVLDLVMVGALGMGTAGAAWATVVAQAVSCLAAYLLLRRRGYLKGLRYAPDLPRWGRILRIGLPSAVQLSVVNLSYLFSTGMFNVFGTAAAAAAGVGLKLNTFAAMPCWAIGQGVTTMAGQCMGHGDPDRAGRTAKAGLVLALGVSVVTAVLVFACAPWLIALFDPSPAVVEAGALYLRICCSVNFIAYTAMYVLDSFATGVGCPTLGMVNALLHSVGMRLGLSWLFAFALGRGYLGLCWAEMLAPFPCALVGAVFFLRGRWREKNVIGA